ncbi:class I SAM-dependent DNA methyltransferase [Planobispora longispora]|uniref:Methyltransferase n=1 Tax=Planobispora longispora TaxID=28887 RepID=A0A8J3RNQ5_9ACTN|nr:class I SAM-dependent methyltransferase [Planobispora longispora]BFE83829.1 class I SAM-dependent methyltransferase [Planobispora longispora]GIH78360.1 methyltransferase [Planobispora longispora]
MTESSCLGTTRTAYDAVAVEYSALFRTAHESKPLDRAMLSAFAELVRSTGSGPVADLGCGPGHVTAYLRSLGLTVSGLDLSPTMIALARAAYPDLRFDEGSMTALDLKDGALGGILSWYSVIHTPPELLPTVFAEFRRVLAPGGHLLLGFFAHDEPSHLAEPLPFDHKVTLAYRWSPGHLADLLRQAGLDVTARLLREPDEDERFLHSRLLARKPSRSPDV